MVEESAELREIARRWVEAGHRRDRATMENLYSSDAVTTYIGTDPDEWWVGRDVAAVVGKHIEEMQAVEFDLLPERVEAYRLGSVGWASVQAKVSFIGREPGTFRVTFVFTLEDGIWKIVQSHNSTAVPNPEFMGVELTTTLEDLLSALGSDPDDEIRESVSEGTVTLVFTDIEDSTQLAQEVGNQRWAEVVGWHDDTIRHIAGEYGGVVVKMLGDGAMLVFEATQPAARAAVAIQRAMGSRVEPPQLRIRVGIHIGDVVQTDDDYLGYAVNKAARVAAAAGGGQIMVSSVVRAMLSDSSDFAFGKPIDVELKGLDGLHEVSQLLW